MHVEDFFEPPVAQADGGGAEFSGGVGEGLAGGIETDGMAEAAEGAGVERNLFMLTR